MRFTWPLQPPISTITENPTELFGPQSHWSTVAGFSVTLSSSSSKEASCSNSQTKRFLLHLHFHSQKKIFRWELFELPSEVSDKCTSFPCGDTACRKAQTVLGYRDDQLVAMHVKGNFVPDSMSGQLSRHYAMPLTQLYHPQLQGGISVLRVLGRGRQPSPYYRRDKPLLPGSKI